LRKLPHVSSKERDFPFVESSTLADDIKYVGGGWQSEWHFIDLPWFDQGGGQDLYPDFKQNPSNLTYVIPQIVSWLRNESGHEESFVYKMMIKRDFSKYLKASTSD
jgi:hypothetical protein